jgi:hypothetical protein
MRYTALISIVALLFFLGCKKNYSSTPSLSYKSENTTVLSSGQTIQFKLSYTDNEGDLDSILVQKIEPKCATSSFTQWYPTPRSLPSGTKKGDFLITFAYTEIPPKCARNDTATFQFTLLDKEKHLSETVVSPTIVIIK